MADDPIKADEIQKLLSEAEASRDSASNGENPDGENPGGENPDGTNQKADDPLTSARGSSPNEQITSLDEIHALLDEAQQTIDSVDEGPDTADSGASAFQFQDLKGQAGSEDAVSMELLDDVELDLKIELGRTNLPLQEVLQLRRGSVVSLDKLVGDPVDVLVNGRLVARGEVLVLSGSFCVRVAELIATEYIRNVSGQSHSREGMKNMLCRYTNRCIARGRVAIAIVFAVLLSSPSAGQYDRPNRSSSLPNSANRSTETHATGRAPSATLDDPIPLPRRRPPAGSYSNPSAPSAPNLVRVFGSLAIVVGLFFGLIWLTRRSLPKSATGLPTEAIEVLGRMPLNNKQHVQMVRVGRKLLVLGVTSNGAETLTEVTDPQEVDHLLAICQRGGSNSVSTSFRQVLNRVNGREGVG